MQTDARFVSAVDNGLLTAKYGVCCKYCSTKLFIEDISSSLSMFPETDENKKWKLQLNYKHYE